MGDAGSVPTGFLLAGLAAIGAHDLLHRICKRDPGFGPFDHRRIAGRHTAFGEIAGGREAMDLRPSP